MKAPSLAIAIFAASLSNTVAADIIKCTFAKPFINTTYSMAERTFTAKRFDSNSSKVTIDVSFQIIGPNQFEIHTKDGTILQKLVLNNKGSDGASSLQYPYSVEWLEQASSPNRGLGGCSSNFLKAKDSGS